MFPLGNRCASINAGTLALIDAGIPMKDFVCASSATYLEDTPMLGELVHCVKVMCGVFKW